MVRRKIIFTLIIVLTGIMMFPLNTYALSKKQKALNAYENFLERYESTFSVEECDWEKTNAESYKYSKEYAVCDMDADGTPELLTIHQSGYKSWNIYIYAYQKGKVKRISKQPIDISSNAGGEYDISMCKKNHLHVIHSTGFSNWDRAYKLNKKGFIYLYLECDESWWNGRDQMMVQCKKNSKIISSAQYRKLRRKCGNENVVHWIDNNAKGRSSL